MENPLWKWWKFWGVKVSPYFWKHPHIVTLSLDLMKFRFGFFDGFLGMVSIPQGHQIRFGIHGWMDRLISTEFTEVIMTQITGKQNGRCLINLYGWKNESPRRITPTWRVDVFLFLLGLLLYSLVDLVWNFQPIPLRIKQIIPTRSHQKVVWDDYGNPRFSWKYMFYEFFEFSYVLYSDSSESDGHFSLG